MKRILLSLPVAVMLCSAARAAEPRQPHVVFVVGENEYFTWQTLPEFAEKELKPQGVRVTFVHAPPKEGSTAFTNYSVIKEADLLFVSVRRRTPPKAMLDLMRAHLNQGKALVGIRTASHAWDAKPADDQHAAWPTFDAEILGAKYEGHYGRTNQGPQAIIKIVPEAANHPVLRGVSPEFPTDSHLYKYRRTGTTVTPLLMGSLPGQPNVELAAWVYTGNNRRVFYTSLGSPDDFKLPAFRRLLLNGTLWALNRPIPAAERPQAQDVPLSPTEALSRFQLPDDLEIEQVLAEPAVAQPVFLNFDERGRMWVVQYRQYPFPAGLKMLSRDNVWRAVYDKVPPAPPNHIRGEDKITIHEDTDGNGTFDKHKTFVEGLNICTSVERGRGGVWVLNPPYLLFYADKNNDDVPDGDPEVSLEGFGLEDTHSVANSLRWGPDGWLYGAQGSTVTANIFVRGPDGKPLNQEPIYSQGQNIWRYHPETRRYEVFSEGGGNAFGCEIDGKGRVFSGHNGGNTRGFHYMQGAYLQKGFEKHGPLSNPYAFGYFPPMPHPDVERFTHNFIIYEGGALPAKYVGKLFGVEPLQGRVVYSEITPDKSSFRTRDLGHVVTTEDKWFKPVDIKVGPDGAIYICDWYDRQVNHYRNHEGAIDRSNGRIYRIKGKGMAVEKALDLAKLSAKDLTLLLTASNKWTRQTALRLLGDQRDRQLIPALRQVLQGSTAQLALEALWALNLVSDSLQPLTAAERPALLSHPDPYVRLWTVRLLGDGKQVAPELAPKLAQLAASESDLEVRAQLACTAKRLPANYAFPIILNLLSHDEDATDNRMPLLLWWAIESKAETDRDAVVGLFTEAEMWKRPLVEQHLLERVMRRYAASGMRQDLATCAKLFSLSPGAQATGKLMAGFEAAFKGRSMANLPAELVEAMAKAGAQSVVIGLRRGDVRALEQALMTIADENANKEKRLQYIQVLGEAKQTKSVSALLKILDEAREKNLCKAALVSLQSYDDPAIGQAVVTAYPNLPEELRAGAFTLLGSRSIWALPLLESVVSGRIEKGQVPPDTVRKLKLYKEARLADLYTKAWGHLTAPTTAEMQKQIQHLASVLRAGSGSPYEGQKVYMASCGACHRLFGQGGQIGPDLTTFKRDDLDNMLLNIVNPNAEIREGYENYLVTTKDDRTVSGFLVDQDNQVVVLRGLDGENTVLLRDQINEMKSAGLSLMPEGLLESFPEQQVRDLFAYLRSTQPLVR